MGKVLPLRPAERDFENEWVVTILVEPKLAFLWAVFKAVVLVRKPIKITHTFKSNPNENMRKTRAGAPK